MSITTLEAVTDADFDQKVLKSDCPVMVFFNADWNHVAKPMAPILEEIRDEYGAKARLLELDFDNNIQISMRCKVTAIPTFLLFKNGHVVNEMVGVVTKDALKAVIDRAI